MNHSQFEQVLAKGARLSEGRKVSQSIKIEISASPFLEAVASYLCYYVPLSENNVDF